MKFILNIALVLIGTIAASASPSAIVQSLSQSQAMTWRNQVVDLNHISDYYRDGNGLLFIQGRKRTALADDLLRDIRRAYNDGLEPEDYLSRELLQTDPLQSDFDAAGFELAMAEAFVRFSRDLYAGRTTPSVTEPDIVIARKPILGNAWLSALGAQGSKETLRRLRPQHRQYYQLRQMLLGYRHLASRGGWNVIASGPTLKAGMNDKRVAALRQNLMARGYSGISGNDAPGIFNEGLKEAVTHFQKRHGLDVDGAVGPATLAALNISVEDRVKQLIVNLERWRWLPRELGASHVFVNQAGFEMFTYRDGELMDNRRVIVGKPFHKTPMFSDNIIYSEFNPTWTVPPSIAGSELLPKLQTDPSFTARNDYKIYAGWGASSPEVNPYMIDWSTVSESRFPYRIVQQPGPKNALGQVKFIFPNKFNVYLHDTPARNLFSRTGRAFSHGCIRVFDPLGYAAVLYSIGGGLNTNQIEAISAAKATKRVNFKRKIPVHLAYFTTWVGDDGLPQFFDDVYGRDQLVGRLLFDQL